MERELIFTELFNLIGSIRAFKYKSRRLKMWTDIAPADMPAMFLTEGNEGVATIRGLDPRVVLSAEIYIYVNAGNDLNAVAQSIMNPILDSVTNLFNFNNIDYGVQTLNGLVHSCKISGSIEKDNGVLGTTAIAIIPIEIITNK